MSSAAPCATTDPTSDSAERGSTSGGARSICSETATPPALGQHFAIRVADLDGAVAELRAGGIELADPSPVGPGRQTFVADPAGNTVELYELVGDAAAG